MKPHFNIKVENKEWLVSLIAAVMVFAILYGGSFFISIYVEATKIVAIGLSIMLFLSTIVFYFIGNFTVYVDDNEFVYKNVIYRKRILLCDILNINEKYVTPINIRLKIKVRNSLNFSFNTNYMDTDELEVLKNVLNERIGEM